MPAARVHLFISGLVQGVFYRASCLEEARARRLAGWVCNLPDGRVEAVAEGEREKVREWVSWCYRGPRGARVTDVEVRWEEPKGERGAFRIC